MSIRLFCLLTALYSVSVLKAQLDECLKRTLFFDIVFRHDFSNNSPGEYRKEEWANDWNKPSWVNQSIGLGRIVSAENNRFLEESFPPGTFMLKGSGTQWHARFRKGYNELYFSYRIKFSSGFMSTALQGKLPGLAGGKSNNGGYMPDGFDGWSARFHFKGTNIQFYIYHPDLYKLHGDIAPVAGKKYYGTGPELQPGFTLKPDVWYTLTQRIVLNTPGESNGLAEGFINGRICARQTGLRFRNTPDLTIDRIFFSNFLGGSGKPTQKTEYISFDDFYVFTYKPWMDVPRDFALTPSGSAILLPDMEKMLTWEQSLKVSNSSDGFTEISWNNSPFKISGFEVERKLTDESGFNALKVLDSDQLLFKDVTAVPGNKYIYRVKAHHPSGVTIYSNEVLAGN